MSKYDIITSSTELQDYVSVPMAFQVEDLKAHFKPVAEKYIIPHTGRTLWDEIYAAKKSGVLTDVQEALFEAILAPFANLCVLAQIPFMDARFSSGGGITVKSNSDEAPASQARVQAIKNRVWAMAYEGLDFMIGYLVANEASFPSYDGSAEAIIKRSRILNRTEEAQRWVPLISNRWLFHRMTPIIDRISDGKVKAALTEAVYDDILDKIQTEAVENPYTATVTPLLQQALSHLAIADGLVELGIHVLPEGIVTFGTTIGTSSDAAAAKLKDKELSDTVTHHLRIGESQLQNAVDHIRANAGSYPAYSEPESYSQDHMPPITKNDGDKIVSPFL